MTNMEAYNAMIDGFAVSHKNFSPDEFLYMDENMIIRDEQGNEYETTWDKKSQMDEFKTEWYICKNRTDIVNKIAAISAKANKGTIGYIEDDAYQVAIEKEPIGSKINRAVFLEDGNQKEFTRQDGMLIQTTISSNISCDKIMTCKKIEKKGPEVCRKCIRKHFSIKRLKLSIPCGISSCISVTLLYDCTFAVFPPVVRTILCAILFIINIIILLFI